MANTSDNSCLAHIHREKEKGGEREKGRRIHKHAHLAGGQKISGH